MEAITKTEIGKGINLFINNTDKFKTSTISIFLHCPLNKDNVTKNALIPFVLKRGSKNYENAGKIYTYLEELYGANFDCGIRKKGEDQIICFNMDFISDKYLENNENLFEKAINFMKDIIFNPFLIDGGFSKDYVESEKENLKSHIEGLINNKREYAVERCIEEMCKGEFFSLYQFGKTSDLNDINEKNLYEHYKVVISESPIDIFLSGDYKKEMFDNAFKDILNLRNDGIYNYPKTIVKKDVSEVSNITQKMEVEQAKLCMGFRTSVFPSSDDFYTLVVLNSIFGGGPHSKLFNNVREKLSLAYYVFSRIERQKGIMLISSGIESQNFQKAYDEIINQLNDIKNGKIEEFEFDAAKNYFINGLISMQDSVYQYEDFYLSQLTSGNVLKNDEIIAKINNVTIDSIKKIAEKIKLDTVYFLTSNKQEEI